MLKDYFELPNKPAVKSGNILSCDFTDHETFIPQPLDYSRGTIATYVDCNGLIKMSGVSDTELVTNGDFATDSDWTLTRASIANGYLILSTSDGSNTGATQTLGTIGKTYQISLEVVNITGTISVVLGGGTDVDISTSGTHTVYITAVSTALEIKRKFGVTNVSATIDNVSVREVDIETPRIDYLTEIGKAKELQKPSLLLEPESTNTATDSNNFTVGDIFNASNNPSSNQSVITANKTTAPDGSNNGWELRDDGEGGVGVCRLVYFGTVVSSGNINTFSVFLKKGSIDYGQLRTDGFEVTANGTTIFDLVNGTIVSSDPDHIDPKIQDYGNGWYRCTISNTATTDTVGSFSVALSRASGGSVPRDGTNFIYMFGVQAETLGYCTSYIPTSGGIRTRNQDLANNAGQLGVFNNEEGVLYCEIQALAADSTNKYIAISNGTTSNRVNIFFDASNVLRGFTIGISSIPSSAIITDSNKVAFKYESGELALFLNGAKVGTRTSSISLSGLDTFSFDNGGAGSKFYGRIKEVKAFRRALTDSELQELTNNIV